MTTPRRELSLGPLSWGFLLLCAVLVSAVRSQAQNDSGSVAGTVVESWDAKPLAGVTVTVRGTTLATTTDALGQYRLDQVPAGDQTLRFSRAGYAAAVVTDVRVLTDQVTKVDGLLRPEFFELEEYVVTAEEFEEQVVQLLQERQEARALIEAIGSERFSRLGASDAADIVSRVSGITVSEGRRAPKVTVTREGDSLCQKGCYPVAALFLVFSVFSLSTVWGLG